MIQGKRKIILKEGVPVEVISVLGGEVQTTIALVGRASKQFNNTASLESHRRGHFLPEITVDSGYIIHNLVTDDYYVVVSTYDEVIENQKAATVAHMVRSNGVIDVSGEVEVADENGNIKKLAQIKYADLRVYAQGITFDLMQYQLGFFADSKFILYAPGVDINILDRIVFKVGGRQIPLKVTTTDYISYPGLVLIQVHAETRR